MSQSRFAWLPNALGFQIVWCVAVGGAAAGMAWAGPLALLVFASAQLALSHSRVSDLKLMGIATVLGFAIDTLWVQLGWIEFSSAQPFASVAPAWTIAMWMGFALTLNHSLAALKPHMTVAVVFGVIGGPLAYWIAAKVWNAAVIDASVLPYMGLAISWGLITPFLLKMATRLDNSPPTPAAA